MNYFKARLTTEDGRLIKDVVYQGHYVKELDAVVIIDELNQPMAFKPNAFNLEWSRLDIPKEVETLASLRKRIQETLYYIECAQVAGDTYNFDIKTVYQLLGEA